MSHTIEIPSSIREIFAGNESPGSGSGSPGPAALDHFGPPGLQSPLSSMATDLSGLQTSIWTPKASDRPVRTPGGAGSLARTTAGGGNRLQDDGSTAPPGILQGMSSSESSLQDDDGPMAAATFTSSPGSSVDAGGAASFGSLRGGSNNTSPSDWQTLASVERSLQGGTSRTPSGSCAMSQDCWTPATPSADWGVPSSSSRGHHPMAATAPPLDVRSPFSGFDAHPLSSSSPYSAFEGSQLHQYQQHQQQQQQDDGFYYLRGALSSPNSPATATTGSSNLNGGMLSGYDSSCMFRHIASSPVMSQQQQGSGNMDALGYSTPQLNRTSSAATGARNCGTPRDIFRGSQTHPSSTASHQGRSSSGGRMYSQMMLGEVSTPQGHRGGGASGSSPWPPIPLRHQSSTAGYATSDAASQRTSTTPCSTSGGKMKGSVMSHHHSNAPSVTLEEIQDKILEMAMDRSGSRVLQKLISDTSASAADGGSHDELEKLIDTIIHEIQPVLSRIMCDTYANYMCQQLFQVSSADQRIALLRNVLENIVYISQDRRGTHSLQALIACMQTPQEHALLAETLHGNVNKMALDVHATHVLQQTITKCTPDGPGREYSHLPMADFGFIFEDIYRNLEALAGDPNGLGVVKKCISHAPWYGDGSYVEKYKSKMLNKLQYFVENPYANYAVQHALEIWGADVCSDIITKISESIVSMAIHKFASNVVETALKVSPDNMRVMLIHHLIDYGNSSCQNAAMITLMNSAYGVFVMSTALRLAPSMELCEQIYRALVKNYQRLPDSRNKQKWDKVLVMAEKRCKKEQQSANDSQMGVLEAREGKTAVGQITADDDDEKEEEDQSISKVAKSLGSVSEGSVLSSSSDGASRPSAGHFHSAIGVSAIPSPTPWSRDRNASADA